MISLGQDATSGAYFDLEVAADRPKTRFTLIVRFDYPDGGYDLEEIDVDAVGPESARAVATAALARDYDAGGRIVETIERPAGVMYL